MKLCGFAHVEICYEKGDCPCCQLIEEVDRLAGELNKSNEYTDELFKKLHDLEGNDAA